MRGLITRPAAVGQWRYGFVCGELTRLYGIVEPLLSDCERKVMRLRWGVEYRNGLNDAPHTQQQVGEILDLCQTSVRQCEARTWRKLSLAVGRKSCVEVEELDLLEEDGEKEG